MNLHVVAYPDLAPADYERIQLCRREHNTLYNIIEPHFTIVFSVPDMELDEFATEVKKQVAGMAAIPFTLRCTVVNKDSFSAYYDALLVPDEGFSGITKLHDRLYSRKLWRYLRLDVSYIPHMSIANSLDVHRIKGVVDKWNAEEFAIQGTVSSLDIINYENRVITTVELIELR